MGETLYSLDDLVRISRGNKVFVNRMKLVFIDEAQRGLNEMETALKANDLQTVSKVAHRMKPSLGNLKIDKLFDPIRRLEKVPDAYEGMQEDLDLLRDVLGQVIADLKREH